ncbi:MAG: hypothetical protein SNJ67_04170 [Chloracidobacterium sp.]|uniref:Glycerophosphoryl diester phosphodiesterase membrane domain-containing protein n=1 Tax=Chloracidobacterium validum TaxID=2821543 RepID=A0ABX8BDW0_9BACT|nr:hypothetical protein [Chloracidobacterium validum]QUW03255.1 hypothetical protein J8C06_02110 [Chloracidobacterium validum]
MTESPLPGRAEELPSLRQLADLEPLSTGDLIDRAVQVYRRNFAPLLYLAILPVLASCVGTLLIAYTSTGLRESVATLPVIIAGLSLGYFLTYIISPLLLMLITGGLTRTVADFVMLDTPISFRRTWRLIRSRLWALIWAQILGSVLFWMALAGLVLVEFFLLWVMILVALLLFGYLPPMVASPLLVLLIMVIVALGFVSYCAVVAQVALIPSVVMIEGRRGWESIVRSLQLARGTIWRITQITLFDMAIASSVISAIGIPIVIYVILNGDFDDLTRTPTWFILAANLADQLGKLVTLPMSTIAYCLLYFDMRVRREGYDVELLGARLENASARGSATTQPPMTPRPSPPVVGPPKTEAATFSP